MKGVAVSDPLWQKNPAWHDPDGLVALSWSQYLPAVHGVHSVTELNPDIELNVPVGHGSNFKPVFDGQK